jgi:hypothetical protein
LAIVAMMNLLAILWLLLVTIGPERYRRTLDPIQQEWEQSSTVTKLVSVILLAFSMQVGAAVAGYIKGLRMGTMVFIAGATMNALLIMLIYSLILA